MALFNENESTEDTTPQETVSPRVEPEVFRGITIDTQYTPASSLLRWVEGSNWTVDYFSQYLGADNEPTPQSLERSAIYQQYKRIKGMELKVTTPIAFQQDQTLKTMEVTGAATTYPFLIPNKGDMFVADIGDGRIGAFTVTQASRSTILRDSVYTIEYVLVEELTRERMDDLEEKTVRTYHFSADSLIRGCGPFVTETEKVRAARYTELFQELLPRYLTDFFSREHSTLLVPDQPLKTYDAFLVRAVLLTTNSQLDNRLRRIREMNVGVDPVMRQPTWWDALVRMDDSYLYGVTQQILVRNTSTFRGRPTMQAIGYTGIHRLIYPVDAPTDVDTFYDGDSHAYSGGSVLQEGRPRRPLPGQPQDQATRNPRYFQTTPVEDDTPPWEGPADIHPVTRDDYYVMSEAFYTNDKAEQSKLEMLVMQMLTGEALNFDQLDSLLESARDWDNLERFYYHPILFVLLKHAARG